MCKPRPPLAKYRVKDDQGEVHEVEAHFAFNNNGLLLFRRADDNADYYAVVGEFLPGKWDSYTRTEIIGEVYNG